MRQIIFPQSWGYLIPSLTNQFTGLIKESFGPVGDHRSRGRDGGAVRDRGDVRPDRGVFHGVAFLYWVAHRVRVGRCYGVRTRFVHVAPGGRRARLTRIPNLGVGTTVTCRRDGTDHQGRRPAEAVRRPSALSGVDIEVRPGEKICIIGPSGSGKSTLLRCINCLEEPDDGMIWLDGAPMGFVEDRAAGRRPRGVRDQPLRASVGMVFQSFNLWPHMTVLRNIIEAPMHVKKIDKAAEATALRASGADWAARQARCLSRPALRRPTTARGDRARAWRWSPR